MIRDDIAIQSIQFDPGGVTFVYVTKDAVRKEGALQMNNQLWVGAHPDYHQELDDLMSKAVEVLADALEDFPNAEVVDLNPDDETDDEPGMGWASDDGDGRPMDETSPVPGG